MNLSRLLPVVFLSLTGIACAADTAASDLASKLSALRQDGNSYVRLRMEIKGPKPETLQLQIKQRLVRGSSEVVYQVLFPKERKGEAVLLKKSGGRASGSIFTLPGVVRPINDLKEGLFGSDLSYEDIIDNFYAWDQQAIVGTEAVDGVSCQILESKAGKGDRSTYGSVRSWIDAKRLVPLRIEKYSGSGQVLRRIDTTRVVSDAGHHIPANLSVRGAGGDSTTLIDGSRIKHDVNYTDNDFSTDGLKDVTVPRGTPE
ncbi:MAG: outer membrane lipoprotein-sorting protein [Chthoniobacter sp.]|uniref:outer membrane lipoprotein-sorting protein n=1 Tax=Chthoniobacter sp. TaxID=2510640 RepID=UPI0032A7BBC5